MGNTFEIEALKNIIRETITKVLYEVSNDRSLFPLYTVKSTARIFHVSEWTVRSWHKNGLLEGRYQVLSGRVCRLIFTNRDLVNFWDNHFPRPEDFTAKPNDPRSTHAAQIQRLFAFGELYKRRRTRHHE
jgi:hypothetical protein